MFNLKAQLKHFLREVTSGVVVLFGTIMPIAGLPFVLFITVLLKFIRCNLCVLNLWFYIGLIL